MIRRLRMVRAQRMTIVNAMLAFVVLIVILQLWLLTATMNAYLGGDTATVVPAAVGGLVGLALNAGLLG
jgi:multidrug resistance efflux pump